MQGLGVGYSHKGPADHVLIERWSKGTWADVSPAIIGARLHSVTAVSDDDVWAVGETTGLANQTLILHWDGSSWSQQPSPTPGYHNQLNGVVATSPTNAWAVGFTENALNEPDKTLVLHWNGTDWKRKPSPSVGIGDNALAAVDATTGSTAWAVGSYYDGAVWRTLILHWDGSGWSRVSSPNYCGPSGGGPFNNYLQSVSMASGNDAWAVGFYNDGSQHLPVLLHWNGTAWTRYKGTVPPSPNGAELYGVVATTAANAWAVGTMSNGTNKRTLAWHWNGSKWAA